MHNTHNIFETIELSRIFFENHNEPTKIFFFGDLYNFDSLMNNNPFNNIEDFIRYEYDTNGINFLNKLNGQFAIVLIDYKQKKIYLIRDKLGTEHLYYSKFNDKLVVSNTIANIYNMPGFDKTIDIESLGQLISKLYVMPPHTILENIKQVEVGQYICLDINGISKCKYYSVIDNYEKCNKFMGTYDEAVILTENKIYEAIELRTKYYGDCATYMSGGYDSTLIAILLQQHNKVKIDTFTIGLEEEGWDESVFASEVAKLIGANNYRVSLSFDKFKDLYEDIEKYYDEPMSDNAIVASTLLAKELGNNNTSVITGTAGDELFCGLAQYLYYEYNNQFEKISKIVNSLFGYVKNRGTLPRKLNKLYYYNTPENRHQTDYLVFWEQYNKLLDKVPQDIEYGILVNQANIENRHMVTELLSSCIEDECYKEGEPLRYYGKNCTRPFLDCNLVEFAYTLPYEYKYKDSILKRIIKDIVFKYIDRRILESHKKQGMGLPINQWLYKDFKYFKQNFLEKDFIERQGLFDYESINKMIKIFESGKDIGIGNYLWNILFFQKWWVRNIK